MLRALFIALFIALLVPTAASAATSQVAAWETTTVDGNPDIRWVGAQWDDSGWIVISLYLHRSVLFTGEDVGVAFDTNNDGGSDYLLKLHQYGDGSTTLLYNAWNGNWMFPEGFHYANGRVEGNGLVNLWVHASELGSPRGGLRFSGYTLGGQYASFADYAPNSGYWILPAPSSAAASGRPSSSAPAELPTETTTGTTPTTDTTTTQTTVTTNEPTTGTSTGGAPVQATLNATSAKAAIRSAVYRRLSAGVKLTLSRCKALDGKRYRCDVRASRRGKVWKGTSTATLAASGRYSATYRAR